MGWADHYISKLKNGETVKFRPRGNSMSGKIESGQLCTVIPIGVDDNIEVGHIVLCTVGGNQYLHLVKAVEADGRYQIGNNHGRINGRITRHQIYGRTVLVED